MPSTKVNRLFLAIYYQLKRVHLTYSNFQLSQIDGITLTMVPSYQTTIRENHINGRVLCECDMQELRDVMEMNFGDWQLFRAWVIRHRATSQSVQQNEA